MTSRNQLINIFQLDVNIIREQISQENHPYFKSFIRYCEESDIIYYFDFDLFKNLVNQYCYDIKKQNYDPYKGYVPEDKLTLFRDIFLEKMNFSSQKTIRWFGHARSYSEERLYNLLFYHIFMISISKRTSVEDIFLQALNDWKISFESNRMPICIDIIIPHTILTDMNEVIISSELKLKFIKSYMSLIGYDLSRISEDYQMLGVILRLKTHQSFNHDFYGGFIRKPVPMNDPKLQEEFQNEINKIKECIISFYLNHFNFHLGGFEIFYPWWIGNEKKTYKTSSIQLRQIRLTSHDTDQIIGLYNQIHNHNIIYDNELELALFNYNALHKKDLLSELILYDFIILENMFTRGSTSEVTFRLALNLALFLSTTYENLQNIFNIMRRLYGIRSKIIHGEDWFSLLRRKNIPALLGLDTSTNDQILAREVHGTLLNYIDNSFKKIINLKIENYTKNKNYHIMENFNGLYFLLNSPFFQNSME